MRRFFPVYGAPRGNFKGPNILLVGMADNEPSYVGIVLSKKEQSSWWRWDINFIDPRYITTEITKKDAIRHLVIAGLDQYINTSYRRSLKLMAEERAVQCALEHVPK